MRSKEEAQDYRYFPDPDLPPLVLDSAFVEEVRAGLPELPRAKRDRFVRELGLSPYAVGVLTSHPRIAAFFEEATSHHGSPVKVANFIQAEVLRDTTTHGLEASFPVTAAQVAGLLKLVDEGSISGKQAKEVYTRMVGTTRSPESVVADLGIQQVSDAAAIDDACRRVVDANPKQAAALKGGKTALLGFFVGQVMKETKGAANPQMVNEALKRLLGI